MTLPVWSDITFPDGVMPGRPKLALVTLHFLGGHIGLAPDPEAVFGKALKKGDITQECYDQHRPMFDTNERIIKCAVETFEASQQLEDNIDNFKPSVRALIRKVIKQHQG